MATTWNFTEVNDPVTGRARFVDEQGNRGVRGVLSAGGAAGTQTYTAAGDVLPALHFKEVRRLRTLHTLSRLLDIRSLAAADVTIANAAATFGVTAGKGLFTQADVGRIVVGTAIPANTFIIRVVDADNAVLSANATGVSAGTYFIGGDDAVTKRPHAGPQSVDLIVVSGVPGSAKLYSTATGAELANATNVTGQAFLVEILGK